MLLSFLWQNTGAEGRDQLKGEGFILLGDFGGSGPCRVVLLLPHHDKAQHHGESQSCLPPHGQKSEIRDDEKDGPGTRHGPQRHAFS